MPRTRDQRCRRVLNVFFEKQLQNVHFVLEKMNVRGWKIGRYLLSIPKQWTVTNPIYDRETRSLIWNNTTKTQVLPNTEKVLEVEQNFKIHFEPSEKNNGTTNISYLRIHETKLSDEKVEYHLIVVYDKEYVPFPEEIDLNQRIEQLERSNEQMTKQLYEYRHETEKYIGYMRRKLHRLIRERDEANYAVTTCSQLFKKNNADYMENYRKIIRECYLELKKNFECPICYESIPNENVFITPCNHVICSECTKRCQNNCPLCRQEMCYVHEQYNDEIIEVDV